jgi:hypothetical protein
MPVGNGAQLCRPLGDVATTTTVVWKPGVAEGEHAVQHGGTVAAHEHRRVRALGGLGPGPDALEAHELAAVARLFMVQIAFIASTRSAIKRIRVRGSVPWSRISS